MFGFRGRERTGTTLVRRAFSSSLHHPHYYYRNSASGSTNTGVYNNGGTGEKSLRLQRVALASQVELGHRAADARSCVTGAVDLRDFSDLHHTLARDSEHHKHIKSTKGQTSLSDYSNYEAANPGHLVARLVVVVAPSSGMRPNHRQVNIAMTPCRKLVKHYP